jgi:hypothetical protein
MGAAAYLKKQFSGLFKAGVAHRVLVWKDLATGLWCKAETDFITDEGILIDVKTTADASFWFFRRNAARLGYINQLAFYLTGLTTITGVLHDQALIAAVETEPPYESHVFKPTVLQLYEASDINYQRIGEITNCLTENKWPGYPDEILCLDSGKYLDDTFRGEFTWTKTNSN